MQKLSESRRVIRWVGALAVLLAATLGVAPPAAAVDVPLDPYEVDVVDRVAEGTVLHEPEDGWLRGYGFGATITFITDPTWVEKGFVTRSAPEGFKLIAFGLNYNEFGEREAEYPVRAAVIADGKRMAIDPLDYPFAKTGGAIFAAAVPVASKSIEFEMESAGTAQRFSLLDAKRVGPQPAILYRDPAAPDVSTDVNTDHVVRASDDEVEAQAALMVGSVRLSWFSPRNPLDVSLAQTHPDERSSPVDPITNPSSEYRAFLIIEGIGAGITPDEGPWFDEIEEIPEADVKIKLPDGTTLESKLPNPKDGGLLMGRHYFEVPANLTNFTLIIGPTSVAGLRVTDEGLNRNTTVRLERAEWEISLPPGNLPVIPEEEAAAPTTAVTTPTTDTDEKPASSALPAVALAVLAAAIIVGTLLLLRRRSRRSATPAEPEAADSPQEAENTIDLLALASGDVIDVGADNSDASLRGSIAVAADERDVYVLRGSGTAGIASAGDARVVVADDLDSLRSAIDVASVEEARARAESRDANGDADTRQAIVLAPDSANADEKRLLEGLGGAATRITVIYLRCDTQPTTVIELDGDRTTSTVPDVVLHAAASPTPPLVPKVSLQLLGAYRIVVDGREVTSGLRSKARELLACLAVNREGATADAAIDVLLPEYEPDKGQAYFRTIVGNVRTVLRTATGASEDTAFISRVGSRYRLDPETMDVDVWAFEDGAQVADGRQDSASTLYRGLLVDGEDYTWAEPIRERFRQRAIDHFVSEAERKRDAGDLDGAIRAAERAVGCDPYAEELYARVIALQEALGRPDAARRTHEAMTRRLAEIGVEPTASRSVVAE